MLLNKDRPSLPRVCLGLFSERNARGGKFLSSPTSSAKPVL